MERLKLAEHEKKERVGLTREQVDALQRLDPSPRIDIAPSAAPDAYDLTPGSMVGMVRLPDLVLEIAPKVPVARVMFLISYSLGSLRLLRNVVDLAGPPPDLVEAMVRLFHAAVQQATHRGLLQGYRTRNEALNVVRGRIRIDDQLRRRFGLAFPIEVRYDEFTTDVEHNRLLKAAVHRLARLPLRSPESRRLLSAMRAVFVNVSDVEYRPHALPDLPVNPLNAHYQPALALARLVLSSGAVELAAGEVRAASFLIDMNRVFEDFVVVALREKLRLTEHAFPQGARDRSLHLDSEKRVSLAPDISWWEDGCCEFVGDVKYKRSSGHDARNSDLYQALAYAVATGLPSALLIYAAADDADEDAGTTYHIMGGKRLEEAVLDLRGTESELLERVGNLAAKARAHRARAGLAPGAALELSLASL